MPGQNLTAKLSPQQLRQLADFREMAEAHLQRLGRAIQARREKLGLSRPELGRKVSAHEKTVERWEKARTAGALDNLEVIAKALEFDSPDDLLAAAMERSESSRKGPAHHETTPSETQGERLDRIEEMLKELLDRFELEDAERDSDDFAQQHAEDDQPGEASDSAPAEKGTGPDA